MSAQEVAIPLGTLVSPDLTTATKLVWLGMEIKPGLKQQLRRSPTRLQKQTGVSRPTVRKALACLDRRHSPKLDGVRGRLGRTVVKVNPGLITDTTVPALARVLYCLLRGLLKLKRNRGLKSYEAIAKAVHLQPRTVSQAIRALVHAGWLAISRENTRSVIHFSFPDPKVARRRADIRRAQQRLEKYKYRGETLALLWCDYLVASKHLQDDYFPGAFTNPNTHELLQADRYYFEHDVAIEFNGPQHEGPTPHFSEKVVAQQMERDKIKREICRRQRVSLVTLRPEDLSFERLREILGRVLPLSDIAKGEPIIQYLQSASEGYLEFIKNLRQQRFRDGQQHGVPTPQAS